jgi:predicted nucleotidyltransferase
MKNKVLSAEELQRLLRQFKEQRGAEYHLLALGYFGSYARGTATPDSDVDVVFDSDKPNLFMASVMRQDLAKFLGRPVDIVQTRGLPPSKFKNRIESEAVYV